MATDSWVIVQEDGSILLHIENDGPAYLEDTKISEREITLEDLKLQHSSRLYEAAKKELKALGFKVNAHDEILKG